MRILFNTILLCSLLFLSISCSKEEPKQKTVQITADSLLPQKGMQFLGHWAGSPDENLYKIYQVDGTCHGRVYVYDDPKKFELLEDIKIISPYKIQYNYKPKGMHRIQGVLDVNQADTNKATATDIVGFINREMVFNLERKTN
ncbi:hypothetical protein JD969_10260 [Planctomycetota bacterium]|nr:hypothetical protein JD969_10260 [Planctomycetota bacterium]